MGKLEDTLKEIHHHYVKAYERSRNKNPSCVASLDFFFVDYRIAHIGLGHVGRALLRLLLLLLHPLLKEEDVQRVHLLPQRRHLSYLIVVRNN